MSLFPRLASGFRRLSARASAPFACGSVLRGRLMRSRPSPADPRPHEFRSRTGAWTKGLPCRTCRNNPRTAVAGDSGYSVTLNVTLPFMIKRFASKVLRRAFEDGNYRRINPQWRTRVELLLDALDAAEKVEDLNLLTLGTHPLKGNRKGEWGMTVTKNWRITFRFEAGDADEVDLKDYH